MFSDNIKGMKIRRTPFFSKNKLSIPDFSKEKDEILEEKIKTLIAQERHHTFQSGDISTLLHKASQEEIYGHISYCLDRLSFWRTTLNFYRTKHNPFSQRPLTSQEVLYFEIRKIFLLWKHKLKICEMISFARKTK
jgi:hypothetical protein